jgi:hypothetical protein
MAGAGLAAMLPYEIFDEAAAINVAGVVLGVVILAYEFFTKRGTAVGAEAS